MSKISFVYRSSFKIVNNIREFIWLSIKFQFRTYFPESAEMKWEEKWLYVLYDIFLSDFNIFEVFLLRVEEYWLSYCKILFLYDGFSLCTHNVTTITIRLLVFFLLNKTIFTIEIKLCQKCFSNLSYTVMTK